MFVNRAVVAFALMVTSAAARDMVVTPALGLPALESPARDLVALGQRLFFDPRLSSTGTVACATCHVPAEGFTQNEVERPVGVSGVPLRRNAPTLWNVGYRTSLLHDGSAATLEAQALGPLFARDEMGNRSADELMARVRGLGDYAPAFQAAYGARPITLDDLIAALAAYERSLVAANAAFDRWFYGGDSDALSAEAKRGFALFVDHDCGTCHRLTNAHAQFTDDDFHDTGVARGDGDDPGRAGVTDDPADRLRFRTPTLRNVALTAPYMHDGSIATLDEVVAFYDRGGVRGDGTRRAGIDPRVRRLDLSERDRADLVVFLESLTGR